METYYITKYALSRGIYKVNDGYRHEDADGCLFGKANPYTDGAKEFLVFNGTYELWGTFSSKHFCRTLDEAIEVFNLLRNHKLSQYDKKIEALSNLGEPEIVSYEGFLVPSLIHETTKEYSHNKPVYLTKYCLTRGSFSIWKTNDYHMEEFGKPIYVYASSLHEGGYYPFSCYFFYKQDAIDDFYFQVQKKIRYLNKKREELINLQEPKIHDCTG